MNFKFLFIPALAGAIGISITSCKSDNAEAKNKSDEVGTHVNTSKFVPIKKLPKGASSLKNLPPNVKSFVQGNYPGYIITIAVSDPLCGGGDAVDVAISKIGSPDLSLIFKPDGTFIQQGQDVPLQTAPLAILQTLKAKYPDYSAGGQIEKLILADNTVEYSVDLSKDMDSKEVTYNIKGDVVCEN